MIGLVYWYTQNLRAIYLYENEDITRAQSLAVCDLSSLNATADRNHTCSISTSAHCRCSSYNPCPDPEVNRRHKTLWYPFCSQQRAGCCLAVDSFTSRALPYALASTTLFQLPPDTDPQEVPALSIVHEIMRKWDSAFLGTAYVVQ